MSFAQYKDLLKDEDGTFKVDWIVVSTNLLGVAIVLLATLHARGPEIATRLGGEITSASLF